MIKRVMALLAFAALASASMQQPLAAQGGQGPTLRISMEEFKKLYAANEVVVLDVRSAPAYAVGHIPGALSVPLENLQSYVPRLKALEKPIVTYCA